MVNAGKQTGAGTQLRGTRHCMVQWIPVFRNAISVLPSNGLSAELSNLVPKPAFPIAPTGGPSVSSHATLRRSSVTDHDTCNSPRGDENAPYFPALVASSWNINAKLTASLAGRNNGLPFRVNRTCP